MAANKIANQIPNWKNRNSESPGPAKPVTMAEINVKIIK